MIRGTLVLFLLTWTCVMCYQFSTRQWWVQSCCLCSPQYFPLVAMQIASVTYQTGATDFVYVLRGLPAIFGKNKFAQMCAILLVEQPPAGQLLYCILGNFGLNAYSGVPSTTDTNIFSHASAKQQKSSEVALTELLV